MWILEHCIWEDIGIWDDTDFWCDSPSLAVISGTLNVVEAPDGVNLIGYVSAPPVEIRAETFSYGHKVILPNRW